MIKKVKYVILIILIIIATSVLAILYLEKTKRSIDSYSINSNSVSLLNVGQARQYDVFRLAENDQDGNNIYESNVYNYSITLDESFSYQLELKEVDASSMKFSISFFSPNNNTNEKINRDTPNGFNLAADNALGLDIYNNPQNINALEVLEFKNWYKDNVIGREVIDLEQNEINDKQILISQESDGIDSIGQYFYLFGEEYIFVLGSDDFTKQEITIIANSLTYE